MPAKSKKQYRFMQAVAHGWKPDEDTDLSEEEAEEFVAHNKGKKSYKNLPEEKHEKTAALRYAAGVIKMTTGGLK